MLGSMSLVDVSVSGSTVCFAPSGWSFDETFVSFVSSPRSSSMQMAFAREFSPDLLHLLVPILDMKAEVLAIRRLYLVHSNSRINE